MAKVLLIEDDKYLADEYISALRDRGCDVIYANNASEGLTHYERYSDELVAVVVDMAMDPGQTFSGLESKGGFTAGLAVARSIFLRDPSLRIVGVSRLAEPAATTWFRENGLPFLFKGENTAQWVASVALDNASGSKQPKPTVFVVHGHDEGTISELKTLLSEAHGINDPVVLRELPGMGRTIIEKLEEQIASAFVAIVLLTPDDVGKPKKGGRKRLRARQNVIFELGYFYGRVGRKTGRVIVLKKGDVELPSDLIGLETVDISRGVKAASLQIAREIDALIA